MDRLDKIFITVYLLMIGFCFVNITYKNQKIIKQNKVIELKLDSIQKQIKTK